MATEELDIDSMWDEVFGADDSEKADASVEAETADTVEKEDEEDEEEADPANQGEDSVEAEEDVDSSEEISPADIAEINRIMGTDYTTTEEIPNHRRFTELRENGRFSVAEALAAIGETPAKKGGKSAGGNNKGHLSATRAKGSNGEVMTHADRQELAKWGLKTEGKALDRLWARTNH